jgi:hypothetical protein
MVYRVGFEGAEPVTPFRTGHARQFTEAFRLATGRRHPHREGVDGQTCER